MYCLPKEVGDFQVAPSRTWFRNLKEKFRQVLSPQTSCYTEGMASAMH